jgi:hypothetical protein
MVLGMILFDIFNFFCWRDNRKHVDILKTHLAFIRSSIEKVYGIIRRQEILKSLQGVNIYKGLTWWRE